MKFLATTLLAAFASARTHGADYSLAGTGAGCSIPMTEDSQLRGYVKFFQPDSIEGIEDYVKVRAKFTGLDALVDEYFVDIFDSKGIDNCMEI